MFIIEEGAVVAMIVW